MPPVDRKGKKKGKKATRDNEDKPKEAYFDKSSATVGSLAGSADIHDVVTSSTTTVVNTNFTSKPYVIHTV
jgi:hypothetical protein